MNIMSGYSLTIRELTREDVRIHNIDLGQVPLEECIAIEPADLGPCVAAVVHYNPTSGNPMPWADTLPNGHEMSSKERLDLADSIAGLIQTFFPFPPFISQD